MDQKPWLIKDKSGKIFGPYEYEKLEAFIDRGLFSGDEMISEYPDGKWMPITQDLNLYSKLLEQLAKSPTKKQQDEIQKELLEANAPAEEEKERDVGTTNKKNITDEPTDAAFKLDLEDEEEDWVDNTYNARTSSTTSNVTTKTIEVRELHTSKSPNRVSRFLFVLLIAIGAMLYITRDFKISEKAELITFVVPDFNKNTTPDAVDVQKNKFLQLLTIYMKSGRSNYLYLREQLVPFLEKNKANVDAVALLCLTYRELWPYTAKSSTELAVLSRLLEQSSRAEAFSASASTCNAVIQLVRGDIAAASNVISRVLFQDSNAVTFYEMQAEVFNKQGNITEAIRYYQQAQKYWGQWQKPLIEEALLRADAGQPAYAKHILEKIINSTEDHEAAASLLAYVELLLNNRQKAAQLIKNFKLTKSDASPSVVARAYHTLAILESERGNKEDAADYAKASLALNANNTTMQQLLQSMGEKYDHKVVKGTGVELVENGDRYFSQGRFLEAQAEYKAAFEMDPKNATAAFKAAESLWELNQEKEAIAWMNQAIKSDPKYFEAHLKLSEYYASRFDFVSTANQMKRAQRINPKDYRLYRYYALIEFKRMNYAGAIKQAEAAIQRYDGDTESLKILTESYLKQNLPREAHYAISKAVALEASNASLQSLYAYSLSMFQGSEAGIRYIKNLINTYPAILEYREAFGRILLDDDKYNDAIAVLQQTIDAGYKDINAYYYIAEAYELKGDLQNSLKTLLSAAQERPSKVDTYIKIGQLQYKVKNYNQAFMQFSVARELNENDPRLNSMLGEALLQLGRHAEAIKFAELEMRRNPKLADGYLLAGDVYTAQGQYSKAAGEYQKVVAINPNSALLYVKIARSHRLAGNYDVARSMLTVASAKESGYAEIYKETGALLEALGNRLEAVDAYNKYLRLSPNAPDQQEIRRLVQTLGG
jgi:tetratricopeptide (TPR) repeat protein